MLLLTQHQLIGVSQQLQQSLSVLGSFHFKVADQFSVDNILNYLCEFIETILNQFYNFRLSCVAQIRDLFGYCQIFLKGLFENQVFHDFQEIDHLAFHFLVIISLKVNLFKNSKFLYQLLDAHVKVLFFNLLQTLLLRFFNNIFLVFIQIV